MCVIPGNRRDWKRRREEGWTDLLSIPIENSTVNSVKSQWVYFINIQGLWTSEKSNKSVADHTCADVNSMRNKFKFLGLNARSMWMVVDYMKSIHLYITSVWQGRFLNKLNSISIRFHFDMFTKDQSLWIPFLWRMDYSNEDVLNKLYQRETVRILLSIIRCANSQQQFITVIKRSLQSPLVVGHF